MARIGETRDRPVTRRPAPLRPTITNAGLNADQLRAYAEAQARAQAASARPSGGTGAVITGGLNADQLRAYAEAQERARAEEEARRRAAPTGPGVPGGESPKDYGTPPDTTPRRDWNDLFRELGLDKPTMDLLERELRTVTDATQASIIGLAVIRGTPWYTRTYPGIVEGIRAGIISDERDYRAKLTLLNDAWRRYYNRDIGAKEYGDLIRTGQEPGMVVRGLQARQYSDTIRRTNPASILTEREIETLGQSLAGFTVQGGEWLRGLYSYAQQSEDLYRRYGRTLTRQSIEQSYGANTSLDTLERQFRSQIALGTLRGAGTTASFFSQGELEEIADVQAGLPSDTGDYLTGLYSYAQQVAPIFDKFGQSVSRAALESEFRKGTTADTIQRRLQAQVDRGALSQSTSAAFFTEAELGGIAEARAGLPVQGGEFLSGLYDYARNVAPIYDRYGQPVDRSNLESMFRKGVTPEVAGRRLEGGVISRSQQQELDLLLGHFGGGTLGEEERRTYGEQQAGLSTDLGTRVALRVQKAQQRIQRAFEGVLAGSPRAGEGIARRSRRYSTSDIGA